MCEPTTIALVASMALTAAAGGIEAKNQRDAGKANAQIERNNARLAEAAAEDAAAQGAREGQQAAWRTRALIGAQRTAAAANGIDADLGSAFDLQAESALLGGADESAIALNAARSAWGFQSEALQRRNQAAQNEWAGKAASKATILKTIGSVVGMGSQLSFKGAGKGSLAGAGGGGSGMTLSPGWKGPR